MRPNEISYTIIGAGMEVHTRLGSGLLESAYQKALVHELKKLGLQFQSQVALAVDYKGERISPAYRVDLIVEESVIVEIKAVDFVLPVHRSQLLSYLKLSGLPIGLLLNFKAAHLKDGIARIINAPESVL